jgi:Phage tail assembly chaperone proteins, E, or 41 or 14
MSQVRTKVTVNLARPIENGDTKVTSITLNEPSVGQLRGLKLSDVLQMDVNSHILLWSRINAEGLTASQLGELCMADVTALSSKTMLFFVSPQQAAQIEESLEKDPTVN